MGDDVRIPFEKPCPAGPHPDPRWARIRCQICKGTGYVRGGLLTIRELRVLLAATPSGQTDVGTGGTSGREVVDTEAADLAHDMALPECRDGAHVGTCRHASRPPTGQPSTPSSNPTGGQTK